VSREASSDQTLYGTATVRAASDGDGYELVSSQRGTVLASGETRVTSLDARGLFELAASVEVAARSDGSAADPARLLRRAARLVDVARAALDLTKRSCAGCGVDRYDRYDHFKMNRELDAAASKLRAFANSDSLAGRLLPPGSVARGEAR